MDCWLCSLFTEKRRKTLGKDADNISFVQPMFFQLQCESHTLSCLKDKQMGKDKRRSVLSLDAFISVPYHRLLLTKGHPSNYNDPTQNISGHSFLWFCNKAAPKIIPALGYFLGSF